MMNKLAEDTIQFFSAKESYFWRWSEHADIIEWQDGTTICYREEIISILRKINTFEIIPPFGSVLLILSACQENWADSDISKDILSSILKLVIENNAEDDHEILKYHFHQALKFMDLVYELPTELRQGSNKVQLIYEILQESSKQLGNRAGHVIISEFESGRLDKYIFQGEQILTLETFQADLQVLSFAGTKITNVNGLKFKILTGLDTVPEIPLIDLIETASIDILDELNQDPQTSGIACLSRQLIASLNIPMHIESLSDLAIGGVSDISNRGTFDKMLLSELAQDDAMITARLANNEALYLRRELPPEKKNKERIIFIDVTLKMWGVLRAAAIGAALALYKKAKSEFTYKAYAIVGNNVQEIDLKTKAGVLTSLQLLDASLSISEGLQLFLNREENSAGKEYILITEESFQKNNRLLKFISDFKKSGFFYILLNRGGILQYCEILKNHIKVIQSIQLDFNKLLFESNVIKPKVENFNDALPAFLSIHPHPLKYPSPGIHPSHYNSFFDEHLGAVSITPTQRLLHWFKDVGATEWVHDFPDGKYFFGFMKDAQLQILVNDSKNSKIILYQISVHDQKVTNHTIQSDIVIFEDAVFCLNLFYIKVAGSGNKYPIQYYLLNCNSLEIYPVSESQAIIELFTNKNTENARINFNQFKRFTNKGYSVLQKAANIYIDDFGDLSIDNYSLKINTTDVTVRISRNKKGLNHRTLESVDLTSNSKIRFYKKVWSDGSVAIVDGRGLLHLKSSDLTMPEMTFILILEKPSACWSANGEIFGYKYFTNSINTANRMNLILFDTWLQKFIKTLK